MIDQCGSDNVDFSLQNEWKAGKYYRDNNISKDIIENNSMLTNCEIPFESELTYWTKIKRINENNFTKTTEYK